MLTLSKGARVQRTMGMMIKVNLPDKTLGITFQHTNVTVPIERNVLMAHGKVVARNIKNIKRKTRATYCAVYEIVGQAMRHVSGGDSVVGIGDNFCKETGRKISLTRALAKLGLGYRDREKVWLAYENRAVLPKEKIH